METMTRAQCPCCRSIQKTHDKKDPEIHKLALENRADELCQLLCSGVYVNTLSEGDFSTALHRAAESGSISCGQALIAHGAFLNFKNLQGKTPLHIVSSI